MPVECVVSENLESFSNFQHGREFCLNQKSSHKRGSVKYNWVAFVLPQSSLVVCVPLCKKTHT